MPFITHLNLAGNDKIDFSSDWTAALVNLTELNLQHTFANMVNANKMPSLKSIDLLVPIVWEKPEYLSIPNRLCTIAPNIQKAITYYYYFAVPVTDILGEHCPNLQTLSISGCLAEFGNSIQQGQLYTPRLEFLYSAFNKFQSFSEITFINAPNLLFLDLNSNEIHTIDSNALTMFMNLKTPNTDWE